MWISIGQNVVAHHVSVIHAGGRFLRVRGIGIAMQACIGVPLHVPQVRDSRPGYAALRGGIQRVLFGRCLIPQVDAVMVDGMLGIGRKHLLHQRINLFPAPLRIEILVVQVLMR